MTTSAHPGETGDQPVYDWRTAPKHYVTSRQLRAAGLGPNRQGVAAWLRPEKPGWKWARLFDTTKAAPKRVPTPAQLEAARKAARERQARAAERRGISRTDLHTEADPGPAWANTTTQEEHMSDPTTPVTLTDAQREEIHDYAAHLDDMYDQALRDAPAVWAVLGEDGTTTTVTETDDAADEKVTRAQERLHEHLREHRDILGTEPVWRPYYEAIDRQAAAAAEPAQEAAPPVATGHGQRMAYLLATVACNQARDRDDRLYRAVEQARAEGPEAVARVDQWAQQRIAVAEARKISYDNYPATVATLADALVWHTESPFVADQLTELTDHYAQTWGVRIDPGQLAVSIDPDVDPIAAQNAAEATSLYTREAAAVDFVSAMTLPEATKAQVVEALSRWQQGIDPHSLRAYLDGAGDRRAQLAADLAAAPISDNDRARVEFVVDYLRGDVSNIDLLESPVFVDPGEEARSRVDGLLQRFAENPKTTAPEIAREISVMTDADQQRVRQAGKEIAAGREVEEIWPGYVERSAFSVDLGDYADDLEELRRDADYLAEGGYSDEERDRLGYVGSASHDETSERIARLAAHREQLLGEAGTGQGLAPMERAQIAATIGDIDTGRIRGRDQLPELPFIDERTKSAVDDVRSSDVASRLSLATREAITQRLDEAGFDATSASRGEDGRLNFEVSWLADTLHTVADGARNGVDQARSDYLDKRDRLGRALTEAGAGQEVKNDIRELIDDRARAAGDLGRTTAERRTQWQTKVDQVVAARDTAAARQAGRDAVAATVTKPPEQACATRPAPSAGQQTPARPGARISHLHQGEVGR